MDKESEGRKEDDKNINKPAKKHSTFKKCKESSQVNIGPLSK